MKRKPDIPNPEKGKKPNREKSFTKARSFAQSEEVKVPIMKVILDYLESPEAHISYRELQEKTGIMQTSLHRPMKGLEKSGHVGYILGRHKFSKRFVKKFFLLTEENRTQLMLFSHGS